MICVDFSRLLGGFPVAREWGGGGRFFSCLGPRLGRARRWRRPLRHARRCRAESGRWQPRRRRAGRQGRGGGACLRGLPLPAGVVPLHCTPGAGRGWASMWSPDGLCQASLRHAKSEWHLLHSYANGSCSREGVLHMSSTAYVGGE